MVDRRLASLQGLLRRREPSSSRARSSSKGSVDELDHQKHRSSSRSSTDNLSAGEAGRLFNGSHGFGGGSGGGECEELARSCLALSVARQSDLWPLLRDFSQKGTTPVAYIAGELDCRYGGGSGGCGSSAGDCDGRHLLGGNSHARHAVGEYDHDDDDGGDGNVFSGVANGAIGNTRSSSKEEDEGEKGKRTGGVEDLGLHRDAGAATRSDSFENSTAYKSSLSGCGNHLHNRSSPTRGERGRRVLPIPPPPETVAETIAAMCPRVRVVLLPDCAHAVPTEAPAALYREVAQVAAYAADAAAAAACARARTAVAEESITAPSSSRSSSTTTSNNLSCETTNSTTALRARAVPSSNGGKVAAAGTVEEERVRLAGQSWWVEGARPGPGPELRSEPESEAGDVVRITGFSLEEFSIPMTAPLQLSLCKLTERRGLLIRLEGEEAVGDTEQGGGRGKGRSMEKKRRVLGVGEVTPLPGEKSEHACVYTSKACMLCARVKFAFVWTSEIAQSCSTRKYSRFDLFFQYPVIHCVSTFNFNFSISKKKVRYITPSLNRKVESIFEVVEAFFARLHCCCPSCPLKLFQQKIIKKIYADKKKIHVNR